MNSHGTVCIVESSLHSGNISYKRVVKNILVNFFAFLGQNCGFNSEKGCKIFLCSNSPLGKNTGKNHEARSR